MGNSNLFSPIALLSFEGFCFLKQESNETHLHLSFKSDTLYFSSAQSSSIIHSIKINQHFKLKSESNSLFTFIFSTTHENLTKVYTLRMKTLQDFQIVGILMKILMRPRWDSSHSLFCKSCAKPFSFFRRQHHCRLCGRVYCKQHASKKAYLQNLAYDRKQRVCDVCYKTI